MQGDIVWDHISTLDFYAAQDSCLVGAVINDDSCAGEGGEGYCNLYIDENSSWVVTGNSLLTNLFCEGTITDGEGKSVTILSADGTVLSEGESQFTVTVNNYSTSCDLSGMGTLSNWEDYAVEF